MIAKVNSFLGRLARVQLTEQKAAVALTLVAFLVGTSFLGSLSYRMVASKPDLVPQTDPAILSERDLLIRRRLALVAKINLCQQEISGRIPETRSVCPPADRHRIEEYRTQVLEIEEKLLESGNE